MWPHEVKFSAFVQAVARGCSSPFLRSGWMWIVEGEQGLAFHKLPKYQKCATLTIYIQCATHVALGKREAVGKH